SSLPIIVQPNAGLPDMFGNAEDQYISPEIFSDLIGSFLDIGVHIVGGCCGSTPLHIKTVAERFYDRKFPKIDEKELTAVSNYSHAVYLKDRTLAIGERINPTGKPRLKRAIIDKDFDYAIKEAQDQIDAGAEILDVNVGVLGIDEVNMLTLMVNKISSATDVPIQIDTSNTDAMAVAMRYYNGKPLVNSVNGKKESMESVFPLLNKYGGVVVALTLDEKGIPETAEERFEIAKKIIDSAEKYGIKKKNIIFDPLTLAVSSDSKSAEVTLKAIKLIKEKLKAKTVLGISNISFGLPSREMLNASFLSMAISAGLDAVILNPLSKLVMGSLHSSNALCGNDEGFSDYISALADEPKEVVKTEKPGESLTLKKAVIAGMAEKSAKITKELLTDNEPMSIVDGHLIPALDEVGIGFELGKVYLPQLLMSAEAVKASFEIIKKSFSKQQGKTRGRVVVATVEGDIHDIGKNIVKSMLENYMFDVVDLGKDVPAEEVLEAALKESTKLVGLSALMTTTVPNMEKTVRLIKSRLPECKVMVGGAVLTKEIAKKIGADMYARDAMASVRCAMEIYG
ncbi:MAG: dihydropteroate synthase, partial [Ruminococcaceae bacterium]|nr:dihydropteroate synthase [Oscillospiraceae bacterium]